MQTITNVSNVTKSYKEHQVLKDVNFTVKSGEIFALLGSNGAGKTTTIRILTTLAKANQGKVEIDGHDVEAKGRKVKRAISVTGQFATVDELLTGKENMLMIARLKRVADPMATTMELLETFHLEDAANRPVSTYSGGMKRRLDIAMSLIGKPKVIFLDEPTTGLDPQSRIAMWEVIRKLSEGGTTIFLTTQYLEEAEKLANRIAVLHEGSIIANGTPAELKDFLPSGMLKLTFATKEHCQQAAVLLSDYRTVVSDLHMMVMTIGEVDEWLDILLALRDKGVEVIRFEEQAPTLEDAFLAMIGQKKGVM